MFHKEDIDAQNNIIHENTAIHVPTYSPIPDRNSLVRDTTPPRQRNTTIYTNSNRIIKKTLKTASHTSRQTEINKTASFIAKEH